MTLTTTLAGVTAVAGTVLAFVLALKAYQADALACPRCGGPLTVHDEVDDCYDPPLMLITCCPACGGPPRYHFWIYPR